MRIYPDLTIVGNAENLATFLSRLDESLGSNLWSRFTEAENELSASSSASEEWRCYANAESQKLPQALLWIKLGRMQWDVTNVVPKGGDRLSPEAYTSLLVSFRAEILPLANDLSLIISNPISEVGPEHWLSKQTAELLHSFSVLANKSTGASHPRDRERWNKFVIAVHNDASQIDGSTISQILNEHEGWPESKAVELGILFEYEQSLLEALTSSV